MADGETPRQTELNQMAINKTNALDGFFTNNAKLLNETPGAKGTASWIDADNASRTFETAAINLRTVSNAMVTEGKQLDVKWTGPGAEAFKLIYKTVQPYIENLARTLDDPWQAIADQHTWKYGAWSVGDAHYRAKEKHNNEWTPAYAEHNKMLDGMFYGTVYERGGTYYSEKIEWDVARGGGSGGGRGSVDHAKIVGLWKAGYLLDTRGHKFWELYDKDLHGKWTNKWAEVDRWFNERRNFYSIELQKNIDEHANNVNMQMGEMNKTYREVLVWFVHPPAQPNFPNATHTRPVLRFTSTSAALATTV